MRKRTGLRNKFRQGRSTYSIEKKSKNADRYASFQGGKPTGPDVIAGTSMYSVILKKREDNE